MLSVLRASSCAEPQAGNTLPARCANMAVAASAPIPFSCTHELPAAQVHALLHESDSEQGSSSEEDDIERYLKRSYAIRGARHLKFYPTGAPPHEWHASAIPRIAPARAALVLVCASCMLGCLHTKAQSLCSM